MSGWSEQSPHFRPENLPLVNLRKSYRPWLDGEMGAAESVHLWFRRGDPVVSGLSGHGFHVTGLGEVTRPVQTHRIRPKCVMRC